MSEEPTPPRLTRAEFDALSPAHAAFAAAGGYDALHTIRMIAKRQGLPFVVGLEVEGGMHAFGYVPPEASAEIQAAAMAVNGRLEDLLTALAAHLTVPVGPHGDGDIHPAENLEVEQNEGG